MDFCFTLEFPSSLPFPYISIISAFCFFREMSVKNLLFSFDQTLFPPLLPILNIYMNFLSFNSAIETVIRLPLLPRAYSAKPFLSSLTPSSMLASPLPPSPLGRYIQSRFDLGCSLPYMVTIFLVFQSISFISISVHSIMPAPY